MNVRIQNIRLTLFKLADPSITSYWVISWGLTAFIPDYVFFGERVGDTALLIPANGGTHGLDKI
jgi:hypothetical protein